ncbi:MAG: Adenine phosphoribosyltransferase [Gemmatimonadetes bacterium]|jgi:adenine phosphoribosyltransferase|nr:Adenine phosphoribosyltransferase [Gemmatimonadota bacterium]
MNDEAAGSLLARAAASLRDVADFPRAGILFRDITPLLGDAALFAGVTAAMAAPWRAAGITHVAAIESRGFILGAPIAQHLAAGFIPVRKPGKLPAPTIAREYALEYGTDRLEVHADACPPGSRVLLVDDVLATGGTASAAAALIEEAGGTVVGCSFLLAIAALGGASRLAGRHVEVLLGPA